jgi:hypothetical protein
MRLILFILMSFPYLLFAGYEVPRNLYSGIPLSDIYAVKIVREGFSESLPVFHNVPQKYDPEAVGGRSVDINPLTRYNGYSLGWCRITNDGPLVIEVTVLDTLKVPLDNKTIRIFPSRKGVEAERISGTNTIIFELPGPGQYSVEIGTEEGWKHGMLVFVDPPETKIPNPKDANWKLLESASPESIKNLQNVTSLYFAPGIHDIGVYRVPDHIKNIYLSEGAWVYGAIIMDGADKSDVTISGRGVLSGARLHLRESHSIEAIGGANNITISGITIADYVHFAIRLLGKNNLVEWTKIVGGWIYNCDGIAAYEGSVIRNCFIWANDDNIKLYDDNILVENVVCWNLSNGAIFQLSWGGFTANQVTVRNVDVIRTDYSGRGWNHGIVNCRVGRGGYNLNYLFENVVIETPSNILVNLAPEGENHPIGNMTFRNWHAKMNMETGVKNKIVGYGPDQEFYGFLFEKFYINGDCLNERNFQDYFQIEYTREIKMTCD